MIDPAVQQRIGQIKAMDDYPLPKGPAMALIRLTQREFTSLAVLAHAIKVDPVFSIRVIKVANGVGGTEHGPVVSLRDAVNVLGVPAVRSLAMGFSLLANFRSGPCGGFDYPRFWSQALARAIALQLLTGAKEACPPEDAFSVGLIARLGELILATLFPRPYADLLQARRGDSGMLPAQSELQAFGATHADLTAEAMQDYNLLEIYVGAAQTFEHALSEDLAAGSGGSVPAQLLALADHIGAICVAAPAEWRALMPKLFRLGSRLGFKADALIALCDRTAYEWREWSALLEIECGPMPRFEECAEPPPSVPAAAVRVPAAPSAPSAPVAPSAVRDVSAAGSGQLCILVVGDEVHVRKPAAALLAAAGHRVLEAPNGRQGFSMAIESQPQIMLVDVAAMEIDGIELTRILRQFKAGRSIYILLLSARNDDETLIQAFGAGADGFLGLPLKPQVLAAHLLAGQRVANLQEELGREQEEIRRISAALSVSNQQLQEVGMTDMLTGCPNRRSAMDRLQQEWAMAVRSQRPLACMVIEIDNLKQVNDEHGHEAGDTALKLLASALKDGMRAQDVLARSSGNEFLVICPDTTLEAAVACAERMRGAVEALPVVGGAHSVRGSVSIGVAIRDATTPSPDALLRLADQSAYLAKRRRNAVATVQSSALDSLRSA